MNYYQTQVPAVVHFQTLGRRGLLRRVLELVWHQKEPVLLQMLPEHRVLLQTVQEQVSTQNAQQLELIQTVLELGWSRMLGQPGWPE
jgi:hypothetical protein